MNVKSSMVLSNNAVTAIHNFVKNNNHFFKLNGNGRKYYSTLDVDDKINIYLKKIREKCFENLNITNFKEEPYFGIFIGVNTESGFVHEHIDPTKNDYVHFRLNFLVSKPENGGVPVVNGNEVNIQERESWINCASKWLHKSTPVVGAKPRIVLSLGGLITEQQAEWVIEKCNTY